MQLTYSLISETKVMLGYAHLINHHECVCVCTHTHTYKQSKTNQEHQANTPPCENNQLNQADNA